MELGSPRGPWGVRGPLCSTAAGTLGLQCWRLVCKQRCEPVGVTPCSRAPQARAPRGPPPRGEAAGVDRKLSWQRAWWREVRSPGPLEDSETRRQASGQMGFARTPRGEYRGD